MSRCRTRQLSPLSTTRERYQAVVAGGGVSRCIIVPAVLAMLPCGWCGHAHAAGEAGTCAPVARIVSIQGTLQVQRAGQTQWSYVRKLDTALCQGDLLHADTGSRAALLISPETIVRLDQNSIVTVRQTTDETIVEFTLDTGLRNPTLSAPNPCGAGYFITRFPRRFRVLTPFVNASVEGTEFLVAMRCESAEVAVFEGRVSAQELLTAASKAVTLKDGESLTAGGGEPPAVKVLVKPIDAVQWALYYPPLSEPGPGVGPDQRCEQSAPDERGRCLMVRAEQRLRVGQVNEAEADIDASLKLVRDDSDADALGSVISVVKNEKQKALALAQHATQLNPVNPRAWIALSYAQQASFKLEDALNSTERAAELTPRSSLAQARVAELLMSLGRIRSAERAAQAAVNANPNDSRAHTILGFVHLAEIDIKQARADFEAAIELDSSAPLPRLGLGLAIIRKGDLKAGREQIEIAVALDPTNSLLRSYVGKAYYEENTAARDKLAATQYGLAEKLDPKDPTPWFYDAILKDSQTRPGEALMDLQRSIELNDARAVYRSTLLLDQDLAARASSQGRVYNELGFTQLGVTEAAESLAVDPASFSAHRFLADMYAATPGHEISRASELLQSQLRQPLGAPPLQPQIANDTLFKTYPYGPSTIGLNEFSPLFMRDGLDLQLFGLAGEQGTWGEQVILNGLRGPLSFSVSQFRTDTNGFRLNNDDSRQQYDLFVQGQISVATSVQFEATHSEEQSGDLQAAFDPSFFNPTQRSTEQLDTYRFGLKQQLSPQSDLLFSAISQERVGSVTIPDPEFPFFVDNTQNSWKTEVQYLTKQTGFNVLAGLSYFSADSTEETPFGTTPSQPFEFEAYTYLYFSLPERFPQLQLGLSYDHLDSRDGGDEKQLNPKLGLIWNPIPPLTVRAALFRVLKRRINSDQGLEPTQVAGFDQFFDDANGTKSRGAGIAMDYRFARSLVGGMEIAGRDLSTPLTLTETGTVEFDQRTERGFFGYLYALPTNWLSVSSRPGFARFTRGDLFSELNSTEFPISVRLFQPSGIWAGLTLTGVWQQGQFVGPGGVLSDGADHFWVADAIVAYRLPQRRGTVSLQGTNLFNKTFRFQDVVAGTPGFVPERQILLRISLEL